MGAQEDFKAYLKNIAQRGSTTYDQSQQDTGVVRNWAIPLAQGNRQQMVASSLGLGEQARQRQATMSNIELMPDGPAKEKARFDVLIGAGTDTARTLAEERKTAIGTLASLGTTEGSLAQGYASIGAGMQNTALDAEARRRAGTWDTIGRFLGKGFDVLSSNWSKIFGGGTPSVVGSTAGQMGEYLAPYGGIEAAGFGGVAAPGATAPISEALAAGGTGAGGASGGGLLSTAAGAYALPAAAGMGLAYIFAKPPWAWGQGTYETNLAKQFQSGEIKLGDPVGGANAIAGWSQNKYWVPRPESEGKQNGVMPVYQGTAQDFFNATGQWPPSYTGPR